MDFRFDVITLFPEMIQGAAGYGVTGKAIETGQVGLFSWNPRDYTHDKYKTVDDRPYGGGPGMLLKYQPVYDAVVAAKAENQEKSSRVVYLSPQGKPLTQAMLANIDQYSQLVLVAGRYEGIDERFVETVCDDEWSIGDYVISGGELAALIVIDAVTRLIPGVLGDSDSAKQDSYSDGLLDTPHYTRPMQGEFGDVPDVLLSGNHEQIRRWRLKQALGRTYSRRPDLLEKKKLTAEQEILLTEFKKEKQL